MCRDIEFACDERVVRSLSPQEKADYSQAMLSCSAPRTYTAACPLAFGSNCVRRRIKRVLGYKKPSARLVVAALTVCVLLSACTLTDPVRPPSDSSGNAADTQPGQPSGTVDPADSEITDPTPENMWKSLEDIREGYTVSEAKRDGCVVMDGSRLVSGEKYWVDFVNRSADGQDAAVRIYQEYTDQGDEYFVKELRHENGKYIFRFWDWKWETDINSPDYGKKQFLSETGPVYQIAKSAMDETYVDDITFHNEDVLVIIEGLTMYLNEEDVKKMFSIINQSFQNVTVLVETMSPFVVKHVKEKSIAGSNAKFTWGIKNGKQLQNLLPDFTLQNEVSLVGGMKELVPMYRVIGKIPAVRNISNKIIVMEKYRKESL